MKLLKLPLKLVALPLFLVLWLISNLAWLAVKLSSHLIGPVLLYLGICAIWCISAHTLAQLWILASVGIALFALPLLITLGIAQVLRVKGCLRSFLRS